MHFVRSLRNGSECGKMPQFSGVLDIEPLAQNEYGYAMRFSWRVALGAMIGPLFLMLFGLVPGCKSKEQVLKEIGQVEDFQFVERSGRLVQRQDLAGRVWVANFFFTGCSIQC